MESKPTPMSDEELIKLCDSNIEQAIGAESGEIATVRQEALDRYLGKLYGNEVPGSSKVTTRETFEVIEWTLASLMRVFTASEKPVSFDPVGAEDEEGAERETEYLSHVILKENRSYMALHNWFKDALMNPNGYIKVWWDGTESVVTETHPMIHEAQLAAMIDDPNIEILAIQEMHVSAEGGYFNVEAKHYDRAGKVCFAPVPGEEVLVDANHTEVSLEDCDMMTHRRRVRLTDLIEMGYPEDVVMNLSDDDDQDYNEERVNRLDYQDEWQQDSLEENPAMRVVWLKEVNIRVDYDGDGIAERRKVVYAGQTMLENKEDPFIPLIAIATIPMPHRHPGLSLADVTEDIQKTSTQLTRQMLNNLYRSNNPRPIVGKGVNMSDVLNDAPNHPIRARDVGQMRMEPITPVIQQVLPALDLMKQRSQTRTGVSEHTMGLSPEVLANATKGAAMQGFEQANGRMETTARNFAEGVKELFLKVHYLLRNYSDVEKQVRLSGGWIPINPSLWGAREDMTINVGIGNSTKDQKLLSAKAIMDVQEKMVAAGGLGRTVTEKNVYNAAALMVEAAGQMDPEKYFQDPELAPPPPDPGPSVEEQALQLQAQIEQSKAEIAQQKNQIEATKADQEAVFKQRDQELKERELVLKEQELALQEVQMQLDAEVERAKLEKDDEGAAAKITEAGIKAQADIEIARVNAQAAAPPKESSAPPVVHIHQGGKKKIQVTRTANGLEGTAEDVGED